MKITVRKPPKAHTQRELDHSDAAWKEIAEAKELLDEVGVLLLNRGYPAARIALDKAGMAVGYANAKLWAAWREQVDPLPPKGRIAIKKKQLPAEEEEE